MGKKYNYIKIVIAGEITEWSGDVLAALSRAPGYPYPAACWYSRR